MTWGWDYEDGPGDYTFAWLQRTEQAAAFRAWHERESLRRQWLLGRVAAYDGPGGGKFGLSLAAEAIEIGGLGPESSILDKVRWHLTNNLFPPVPTSMAGVRCRDRRCETWPRSRQLHVPAARHRVVQPRW